MTIKKRFIYTDSEFVTEQDRIEFLDSQNRGTTYAEPHGVIQLKTDN